LKLLTAALVGLAYLVSTAAVRGADRPNIVWILSEDNSVHYLRLYGDPLGITPNIERLAENGITFEHAFSNAPVCSVARTTLMTGMYAPRIGFQFHRRLEPAHLPGNAQLFPAYLRKAGYYVTNNNKKDYNVVEGEVWNESSKNASWRNRPNRETPFFHMQTTTLSHESSLHFNRQEMNRDQPATNPADVAIAPYHPDTPTFRYTYARYHDRMRAIDDEVGNLVTQLADAGLLEDTFIFYFGDHGGVLPRSKGYLYETGLHVPLVVRVPGNWRHLVDLERGARMGGFVSFIDFAPTVLNLAGVEVPDSMDGRPFLGAGTTAEELSRRDTTFSYADRFDEKYDFVRSLRRGRFKYIRNYQSYYPDALQNNYRYIMLAYAEWRELHRAGGLNEVQTQFFEPKPVEALFDIEQDPHEVHNLADDPDHRDLLLSLRSALQTHVKTLPDLSFYPENVLVDEALDDGAAFGQEHAGRIGDYVDTIDLALFPIDEAMPALRDALRDNDPWRRYWALTACSCFGEAAASLASDARAVLGDSELLVRVRAAEFLSIIGAEDPRPTLYGVLAASASKAETLITMNTVVFLHDRTPSWGFDFAKHPPRITDGEVERRLQYLSSE